MSERVAASLNNREIYMVLSPRSLGYARVALESLFERALEPLNVHLITDSNEDGDILRDAVEAIAPEGRHRWSVTAEDELSDAEEVRFGGLPNLRAFRHRHPCWRKITDPLLIGAPGAELVLLDPDVYFPSEFRFEETPATGLKLMWQAPNCLLPPEVVRSAMNQGIRLARHVDIGVSHWRAGGDLEWLDWMIGKIGGTSLPRMMHVEAIVWAAIAMREGGGYLDPANWVCWHRSQSKRLRRKLGASGPQILASEPWGQMKCFHAGGEAKWWVPEVADTLEIADKEAVGSGRTLPFVELTKARYEREQSAKGLLRGLGYYRLFGAKTA
jgi:hypothetical protein